jgi:hypothetical protein
MRDRQRGLKCPMGKSDPGPIPFTGLHGEVFDESHDRGGVRLRCPLNSTSLDAIRLCRQCVTTRFDSVANPNESPGPVGDTLAAERYM